MAQHCIEQNTHFSRRGAGGVFYDDPHQAENVLDLRISRFQEKSTETVGNAMRATIQSHRHTLQCGSTPPLQPPLCSRPSACSCMSKFESRHRPAISLRSPSNQSATQFKWQITSAISKEQTPPPLTPLLTCKTPALSRFRPHLRVRRNAVMQANRPSMSYA